MSKIVTKWIADDAVTKDKLNADIAGDGLSQAAGGELDVQADAVGGANLAKAINVDPTNGVAVKVNDDTIGENGSGQLEVKANSIGAAEVDETDNYTWTGTHDFSSGTITGPTPTTDAQLVTKAYADALRQGMRPKDPVRALSDSNLALTGDPGTVDGVTTWVTGQRILLTGQTSPAEEGIWVVDTTGAWSRPADYDAGDSAAGATVWVNEGAIYGDSQWVATADPPNDEIDADDPAFVQSSGAGQVNAGTGLTKGGNTLHVGSGTVEQRGGLDFQADDVAVFPDATGGANLAKAINVSNNGVAVKVDASTVNENGSGQLFVPNAGITETQLNTSVGGAGISGGGGSPLALDINELTEEATNDAADMVAIYDDSATAIRKMSVSNLLSGTLTENVKQEMHLVTAGEVTNGFFTLAEVPLNVGSVRARPVGGPDQVNKDLVGATGATPDFQIISTNQFHFNNNGAATGLSGDILAGDILIVAYAV